MKETLLYDKIVNGRLAFNSWISFYKGPMRLRIYKDKVIASALFLRKTIPTSKIKRLTQLTWGPMGYARFEPPSGVIIRLIGFRISSKDDPNLKEVSLALKKAGVVW